MINVAHVHEFGTGWQNRGMATLDGVQKAQKKAHKAEQATPAAPAATSKPQRPQMQFSTDWRTSPEYNPHGLPADQVVHPDPVNANRMSNFADAARRLAAHSDNRIDEMRNQGK